MWYKIYTKNLKNIGSICRSSKFLYKKMVASLDFSKDLHLAEFGPGDGVFTDELLKQLSKNSHLTLFEIDPSFFSFLEKRYKDDPRVTIYHQSAETIGQYIKPHSLDGVISSLPLAFFEETLISDICEASKSVLKSDGLFLQYQYFLQNNKQLLSLFSAVKYSFTPLNIPPAFIYTCHK